MIIAWELNGAQVVNVLQDSKGGADALVLRLADGRIVSVMGRVDGGLDVDRVPQILEPLQP